MEDEQVGNSLVLLERQLQFLLLLLFLFFGRMIAVDMAVDGPIDGWHILGILGISLVHRLFLDIPEWLVLTVQLNIRLLNSDDGLVEEPEGLFHVFGGNFVL